MPQNELNENEKNTMLFLGIESSCDDTAVAIVSDDKTILAENRLSHLKANEPYGGVVPEIMARAHLTHLKSLIQKTVQEANVPLEKIDAFAATAGPGLIGGVITGVQMAKALALYFGKPFYGINHLEGHALTPRLTHDLPFPYLLLLVSGGHTQFLKVEGVGRYQLIGTTLDDALGEAFDKVGKMMGLPYPAGPLIEQLAKEGKPTFDFPRPLCQKKGTDFSFSGLKSDVRRKIAALPKLTDTDKKNIAASFQTTVRDVLLNRLKHVLTDIGPIRHFVISGGVAANQYLRGELEAFCMSKNIEFVAPPLPLCTDNGAMIAWAGIENALAGRPADLSINPRPRWPLDSLGH